MCEWNIPVPQNAFLKDISSAEVLQSQIANIWIRCHKKSESQGGLA
ncbi:hypothetical protein HMPREF0658_1138 [Hoylesella marshii DSM 16973 = JCM 13450]|uniref:Uncharacterized protein n=1 Tax=Hoylesella marshii DSM 16973 = JCM 13450 TaxID=862515 RepID=E0NSI7_9BACT|nr:hypothetical protein HMPREF0658_1138 [Hoylesella marshii DSM 16973 = JCM 13450]